MENILEFVNVHYRIDGPDGALHLLNGVSFSLSRGESLAITGPSGSGKTSMLRLAAGLVPISEGHIHLDGADLAKIDAEGRAVLRRTKLGQVFQHFRLVENLDAIENVVLGQELAGLEVDFDAAADALAQVGLEHRMQHRPAMLSGGERQRVGIARALIHNPPLVLADEPTGNLDRDRAGQVFELLLASVEARGAGLILVTHDPELAARCGRKLVIRGGVLH